MYPARVLDRILDPAILALAIPIVAILGGFSVALSRIWIHHRERMAMIERGLHPDHPLRDEGPLELEAGDSEEAYLEELELRDRVPRR